MMVIEVHKELNLGDLKARRIFRELILDKLNEELHFKSTILFINKTMTSFLHHCDNAIPHDIRFLNYQQRWKMNVGGRVVDNFVTGPYFFDINLNDNIHLEF